MTDKSNRRAPQSQQVISGINLRIEEPKSNRRNQRRTTTTIVTTVNPASGFVGFLRENAIIGLAIGFVVGTQVQVVVKQLISSFIDPLFQLLFGQALSQKTFELHLNGKVAVFGWGVFVYAVINFLFILLVIYVIIKFLKLDKLDKPKAKK